MKKNLKRKFKKKAKNKYIKHLFTLYYNIYRYIID